MTEQGMIPDGRSVPQHTTDMVELRLLLPSNQFTALEEAAVRLELPVDTLVSRAVSDFLQSHAIVGFVGEVAGRPTAPFTEETQ